MHTQAPSKLSHTGNQIGDGAGPLVAGNSMHGYETRKVGKDCVVATVPFEGRIAFVLKAEGPGGNVANQAKQSYKS